MINKEDLLQKYYPGIAKIDKELAEEVIKRANGKCEIEGCNKRGVEIHHIAGRRRKAHLNNLILLCIDHHKPPHGIHGNKKLYEKIMKKYQNWCFKQGFTEEEVRYLLGTKSMKLFWGE